MARGRQSVYLNYAALVLLGHASGVSAYDNVWTVNIDNTPAPSPDQGPPFSANALRDPSYLPYQILGIVGSYFIVVLFIGTLLLSFGQRARKRAQLLAESEKSTELKTLFNSPNPAQSVKSLNNKKSITTSTMDLSRSPISESNVSFDAGVIAADRDRRAQEMEKLYAAVMVQEDTRSYGRSLTSSPPQYAQHAPGLRHLQDEQAIPRSPVKAIYPNDGHWPSASQHSKSFSNTSSGSGDRAPSVVSAKSSNSLSSKKYRKSIRNLKISGPMIMRGDDNDDGARTPLSPRTYPNPGVPPEPPMTGRTIDMYESGWPEDEEYEHYNEQDEIHELPRANGRNFSQPLRVDAQQQTQLSTTVSPSNALPFRQLHWNSPTSPMYPYQGQGPFSAGPTKTTFVEVRRDRLGAPLTGAITPYSAYMPFTPLTPVTPRLTTRAERRQREREERTVHGAITEEDQVVDDKELWGDSY